MFGKVTRSGAKYSFGRFHLAADPPPSGFYEMLRVSLGKIMVRHIVNWEFA